MSLLEIKNLKVRVDDREILKGINLKLNAGEVHSIMGPNGSGKSTLAQVLARRETYDVTGGEVLFNGKDLLAMKPEEAACEGLFLAFQYPVEIPGISNAYFLRSALNAIRKYRGAGRNGRHGFSAHVARKAEAARHGRKADEPLRERSLFRRREEAQRDSADGRAGAEARHSGRDRFRVWISTRCRIVAQGVNAMRSPERAMLVVTHYQRLLNYIVPDFVHVLVDGRIVRSGGPELALELEEKGYADDRSRRARRSA